MFGLGPYHLALIGVVVVLLFGNRLPSVARSFGSSITEFKKGLSGLNDDGKEIERLVKAPVPPPIQGTGEVKTSV